jgi:hypothetical protein
MAKHRKVSRMNPALVILALFFGILFVLSLFSFVDIRSSAPIAANPPTSQNVVPTTPGTNTTLVPTHAQVTPQNSPSSRVINAPAPNTPAQKAPETQSIVVTTTNNPPPLPLPALPPVQPTKPLLRLDNGLEVNVPLLDLGVTIAPLK